MTTAHQLQGAVHPAVRNFNAQFISALFANGCAHGGPFSAARRAHQAQALSSAL